MTEEIKLLVKNLKEEISESLILIADILNKDVKDNPILATEKLSDLSVYAGRSGYILTKAKMMVRLCKSELLKETIPFTVVAERKMYIEGEINEEILLMESAEQQNKELHACSDMLRTIISWHKQDKQNTQ